jgi:hypothetical protein
MADSSTRAVYEDVLSLQNYLVGIATGTPRNEGEYRSIRNAVVDNTSLLLRLPEFVRTCHSAGSFWSYITRGRDSYQERREYIWKEFKELLLYLENPNMHPSYEATSTVLRTVDHESVQSSWQKAIERIDSDPEGAITAARTLVESVCIHILEKGGVELDEKWDLSRLYKESASLLHLAPEQHKEEIFKQILGGCSTVVNGLASMRNKLGDAHGKKRNYVKPTSRHATLAVNLGGALATFLITTYEEKGLRP